jgi:glutamate/tyrosine decarboxylase-like PLP-dependent enzyme
VEWVEASEDFELAAAHTLPIIVFRFKAPGLSPEQLVNAHTQIVEEVTCSGQRWISETLVNGRSVIRMMLISYLTEERHLQGLEAALLGAAKKIVLPDKAG